MSRNYFQAKNYCWERSHGMIVCIDPTAWHPHQSKLLFSIYDEGGDDNLINAFMKGYEKGREDGEKDLASKVKALLRVD